MHNINTDDNNINTDNNNNDKDNNNNDKDANNNDKDDNNNDKDANNNNKDDNNNNKNDNNNNKDDNNNDKDANNNDKDANNNNKDTNNNNKDANNNDKNTNNIYVNTNKSTFNSQLSTFNFQPSIFMKKYILFLSLFSLACLVWQCGNDDNNGNTPTPDAPVELKLTSFSPTRDTTGANITLTGTGFSATASQNLVKFNGTVAQVTNASATSLTVKVPAGAVKGKISVEVSSKTVTSTDDFIVTGWQQRADFGGAARINGSGFVLNGKIYYGLGVKGFAGANVLGGGDFWEYNPATNAWTQKLSHPAINDGAGSSVESQPVSFAINGKGYVALGSLRAVWEYDPTANTWTKKNQNHPLGTSASLQSAIAFVVNGKAYVCGGTGSTSRRELHEYDPVANTWTKKADFPDANGIYRTQAFVIGTKGYLGAGVVGSGTKKFWSYDTATNTWAEIASYPGNNAADAVATSLNDKGYVRVNGSLYEYNPTTNTWATKTYKPQYWHALALIIEDKIYWAGGGSGDLTKQFWTYLP